ncbi:MULTISPECIES: hypothetical protein [Streptomyces]|uniref:Uncharacterized protein n=1 Tax=Streptomyces zinciresistens K42 TaxID=700597 RepID=G2G762_9ACTN|nr:MULTISPECIES: hypothetical protein [Streptomyces]EGX60603.1 hypothetical protein SZN_06621 [Streptomyces zinciresistens K42]MDT9695919.1 hypothetical protein [Streptomyces sp. P17]
MEVEDSELIVPVPLPRDVAETAPTHSVPDLVAAPERHAGDADLRLFRPIVRDAFRSEH